MNRKVLKLQLAIGSDLLGSKMSFAASKTVSMIELEHGIEVTNGNRRIIVPYSNCKAYEVEQDNATEVSLKPEPKAKK
jgi:hypothetical protein